MKSTSIISASLFLGAILVFSLSSKVPESPNAIWNKEPEEQRVAPPTLTAASTVDEVILRKEYAATDGGGRKFDIGHFERLLETNRFSEAVDLYQSAYSRYRESESQLFRNMLIERSVELAKIDPPSAIELLSHYVRVFYRDVEALVRLAKLHELQRDYAQAVVSLQEAYLAAHTTTDLASIQSQIDRVVRQYSRNITSSNNPSALVSLYRSMIERQPDHAPYYLALARAHLAADDRQAALAALRYIQYDSNVGGQARVLISKLQEAHGGTLSDGDFDVIPLTRDGNHYIVNASVNGRSARLILDTGASITTLKSAFATYAEIPIERSRTVVLHTANGPVRAPLSMIDRFKVGETAASNFKVVVLDLPSLSGMDGLLGMDYLSRYRFTIDRSSNTLLLSK